MCVMPFGPRENFPPSNEGEVRVTSEEGQTYKYTKYSLIVFFPLLSSPLLPFFPVNAERSETLYLFSEDPHPPFRLLGIYLVLREENRQGERYQKL